MGSYGRDQGNSGKEDLVGVCWCRKNHLGRCSGGFAGAFTNYIGYGNPFALTVIMLFCFTGGVSERTMETVLKTVVRKYRGFESHPLRQSR